MKNIFIIIILMGLLFACTEQGGSSGGGNSENSELADIVLYDGVMNDSFNEIFQNITWGFPNSMIQIKFIFSDPEVFEGTVIIETNTTANAFCIFNQPEFTTIRNIDLTNSNYFLIHEEFENEIEYDGRDLDCQIIWLR